jgi:hypothetical protein
VVLGQNADASVGTGGIVKSLIAAHAAADTTEVGYIGGKRYLKVLADFSGTHGTGHADRGGARQGSPADEITAANGYSAGGIALASPTFTAITKGFKFTSNNVTWTASGGNIAAWRYFVLYVNATVNGVVKPLIGYCLGDAAPADVAATTDTNVLTITCPSGGWFDMTRP